MVFLYGRLIEICTFSGTKFHWNFTLPVLNQTVQTLTKSGEIKAVKPSVRLSGVPDHLPLLSCPDVLRKFTLRKNFTKIIFRTESDDKMTKGCTDLESS